MVFRLNHGSTLCGPSDTASGGTSPRSCWRSPCPFAVNSATATNVFVAARARVVVPFAVVVAAAVAVAIAAMALAAAMARLHDVSSLFRVPTLE